MFDTGKKLKILAIGAHGDDIELACGGTLAMVQVIIMM